MPAFMAILGFLFWLAAVVFWLDAVSIGIRGQYVTHQIVGQTSMLLAVLCSGFGGMFFGIGGIIYRLAPKESAPADTISKALPVPESSTLTEWFERWARAQGDAAIARSGRPNPL